MAEKDTKDKDQDAPAAPEPKGEHEDKPKAKAEQADAPKPAATQADAPALLAASPDECMTMDDFSLRVQGEHSRELLTVWRRYARAEGLVYAPEADFTESLAAYGALPAE